MSVTSDKRPTSHSYFSQRLRLHYLDWGNASAPHVLLIHGVQDHCHSWDWVAAELARDYHVVAPDLRGHGDSEWAMGGGYAYLDFVFDLIQLVDQEQLHPVHVVGHSFGGALACLFAGLYPEKTASLVSVEGIGGHPAFNRSGEPRKRILDWVDHTRSLAARQPRRYESMQAAQTRMQKINTHLSEEQAHHLTAHGSNRNEDGTFTWKFDNYTHTFPPYHISFEDTVALWEDITCRTLLLNSDNGFSHRTGQNDTLRHFRRGEMDVIEDAGHWVHHDQLREFMDRLQTFLSEVRQETS